LKIEVTRFEENDYVIEIDTETNYLTIETDNLEKIYREYSCMVKGVWQNLKEPQIISIYDKIEIDTIEDIIPELTLSPIEITDTKLEIKRMTPEVAKLIKKEFPDIYKILEIVNELDYLYYGKYNPYCMNKIYVSSLVISICGDSVEDIINKYNKCKKIENTYHTIKDLKISYDDELEIDGVYDNIDFTIVNPPETNAITTLIKEISKAKKIAEQNKLFVSHIKIDYTKNKVYYEFTNGDNSEYYTICKEELSNLQQIVKQVRTIKKQVKDIEVITYERGEIAISTPDITITSSLNYYSITLSEETIEEFDRLIKLINKYNPNKYVEMVKVKHHETAKLLKLYNFITKLLT